jgi:hypothetical protein
VRKRNARKPPSKSIAKNVVVGVYSGRQKKEKSKKKKEKKKEASSLHYMTSHWLVAWKFYS